MGYRGTFVKNTQVQSGYSAANNWGTGVDARHSDASMVNDQGFPSLKTPHVPATPEYVEDTYNPNAENAIQLPSTDYEPKGHDGSGTPPLTSNRYDEIRSDTARHSENLGATLKNTAHMVMRSFTQTFASPRVESLPPSNDDASATYTGAARRALRGLNSLAENNPGSAEVNFSGNYIRQGRELYRWTDRRMPRVRLTHTQRPIYLNTADVAHVTTSPQGENYSPYGSPFPSVGRFTVGASRSMQRREPRPWDEDTVTDGSEQSIYADTAQFNAWGL